MPSEAFRLTTTTASTSNVLADWKSSPHLWQPALLGMVVVCLGVVTALTIVLFGPFAALAAIVVLASLAIGVLNWRASVYGLLLYLPFSGIAILTNTPSSGTAALIKDMLFVGPAYIGFALALRKRSFRLPRSVIIPIALFGSIVVLQTLNPYLPNRLVGLIGVKVWLSYIPLLVLGYYLVESRRDLTRLLGLITAAALLPAIIGIVEAIAIYSGAGQVVYSLYGSAATTSTQNFFADNAAGGSIYRIPSIFSFISQYFALMSTMLVMSYGWWRNTSHRWLGLGLWCVMLIGALTSGARGAFLMIPLLVVLTALFEGRLGRGLTTALIVVTGLLGTVSLFGAGLLPLLTRALDIGSIEVQHNFLAGMGDVMTRPWGLGTGSLTNASRYAFPDQINPAFYFNISESWWVKAGWELGVLGLIALVFTILGMLKLLFAAHLKLTDQGLRAISAGIIAFTIWNLVYATKGYYIDLDPINVYFWLLPGILLRLPILSVAKDSATSAFRNQFAASVSR